MGAALPVTSQSIVKNPFETTVLMLKLHGGALKLHWEHWEHWEVDCVTSSKECSELVERRDPLLDTLGVLGPSVPAGPGLGSCVLRRGTVSRTHGNHAREHGAQTRERGQVLHVCMLTFFCPV